MVRTWIHQVPFRWEKSNCRSIWITKQRAQSRNTSVKAPLPQTFLDCKSAGNSVPQKRFRVKQLSQSHSKHKSSHWEVRETPQEKNHSEIQFAILNLNLKYIYIFFFWHFFENARKKEKNKSLCTDSHLLSAGTWDMKLRCFSLLFITDHGRLRKQSKWMLSYNIQKYSCSKLGWNTHMLIHTHARAHAHTTL